MQATAACSTGIALRTCSASTYFRGMPNTVYIIVDGREDERHICAVFSSRQAAEAALCYADENAAIEMFAVDAALPPAPAGTSFWTVSECDGYFAVRMSAFRFKLKKQVQQSDNEYLVDVWATDEQEALRLGSERIERFKARKGK